METINIDQYWRESAAQWQQREEFWIDSAAGWDSAGRNELAIRSRNRASYAAKMAAWASSRGQNPLPEEVA